MPDPGQLAILIPIIALMIPIVKVLTDHQRRMAEMMAAQHRDLLEIENRRLSSIPAPAMDVNAQYELQMMRDRLAQMEAKLAQAENRQQISG